jgi:NADH:ubiquinone oxidoreductase subunit 3 (subunit A)
MAILEVFSSFLLWRSVLLVNVKKINRKIEHRKSTYPLGSQEIKDDVEQKNIQYQMVFILFYTL